MAAATAAAAKTNSKPYSSVISQEQQLYSQYSGQPNASSESNPVNAAAGYMQNYSMYNMMNPSSVPTGVPPVGQPFGNQSSFPNPMPSYGHSVRPLTPPLPFMGVSCYFLWLRFCVYLLIITRIIIIG